MRNLNNDINSVFNNFQQDEYWIYWAYIDTENKTPEEIAEVMINLYNLLKTKLQ